MTNTIINRSSGQAGILVLLGLVIAGVLLFQYKSGSYTTTSVSNQELQQNVPCYQLNPSITINYNGNVYIQMKGATAIPTGELGYHLQDIGKVQTPQGEEEGYLAQEKNGVPVSVTWDTGSFNMLFVDVSNTVQTQIPGYKYFSFYLKQNSPIPDYIQQYCNNNLPTSPITIFPDINGNTIPPTIFNTSQIAFSSIPSGHNPPPTNTPYYIFSYEANGSPSYALSN